MAVARYRGYPCNPVVLLAAVGGRLVWRSHGTEGTLAALRFRWQPFVGELHGDRTVPRVTSRPCVFVHGAWVVELFGGRRTSEDTSRPPPSNIRQPLTANRRPDQPPLTACCRGVARDIARLNQGLLSERVFGRNRLQVHLQEISWKRRCGLQVISAISQDLGGSCKGSCRSSCRLFVDFS